MIGTPITCSSLHISGAMVLQDTSSSLSAPSMHQASADWGSSTIVTLMSSPTKRLQSPVEIAVYWSVIAQQNKGCGVHY